MARVPSVQVDAAYEMGRVEARVSIKDDTLVAHDLTKYLRNAEIAQMMADNKVLAYIVDSGMIDKSRLLRKTYNKYKSKYWKS